MVQRKFEPLRLKKTQSTKHRCPVTGHLLSEYELRSCVMGSTWCLERAAGDACCTLVHVKQVRAAAVAAEPTHPLQAKTRSTSFNTTKRSRCSSNRANHISNHLCSIRNRVRYRSHCIRTEMISIDLPLLTIHISISISPSQESSCSPAEMPSPPLLKDKQI